MSLPSLRSTSPVPGYLRGGQAAAHFSQYLVDGPSDQQLSVYDGSRQRKQSPTPAFEVGKSRKRKGYETGVAGNSRNPDLEDIWDIVAGNDVKVEEHNDMNKLFKPSKKKKRIEKSPAEISMIVEEHMAEFEVTAEEDAELNRKNQPAINKLKKLPLLIEVLSKKELQLDFLDHGVLTLLKSWLEPLPDGSLPNMNIRTAILKLLSNFPINLEQLDRREQLKKSALGKVIMFLSISDEETPANRKLAKELVEKWSRPIFKNSTRFEDMREYEDKRIPYRRPILKSQPEALPLKYLVRPQSIVALEEFRPWIDPPMQNPHHLKINKKLQQLKALKKKPLQASKLSAKGHGMYL